MARSSTKSAEFGAPPTRRRITTRPAKFPLAVARTVRSEVGSKASKHFSMAIPVGSSKIGSARTAVGGAGATAGGLDATGAPDMAVAAAGFAGETPGPDGFTVGVTALTVDGGVGWGIAGRSRS